MAIDHAVLYRASQELVLENGNRPAPMLTWRFKVLYMDDLIKRFQKGRGYMTELLGRFDLNGNLDVIDIHNEHASDFEIVCGPEAEYISQRYTDTQRVTLVKNQQNTKFPGSDLETIRLRIFAGPSPTDLARLRWEYVSISDPASLIWELLSNSALPLSTTLDQKYGGFDYRLVHQKKPGRRVSIDEQMDWHAGKKGDIVEDHRYSVPYVVKRRILKGIRFEIF